MKRLLLISAVCLAALAGCSKETPQPKDEEAGKIASVLNGHFKAQTESLGSMEYDEITFRPFASPKEVVSLFGTFNAYGSADISHYFNDHALETGGTYYYTIDGYNSSVSFYGYSGDNVTSGEDKYDYSPVSSSEFKLRKHGSAITKTFLKQ